MLGFLLNQPPYFHLSIKIEEGIVQVKLHTHSNFTITYQVLENILEEVKDSCAALENPHPLLLDLTSASMLTAVAHLFLENFKINQAQHFNITALAILMPKSVGLLN